MRKRSEYRDGGKIIGSSGFFGGRISADHLDLFVYVDGGLPFALFFIPTHALISRRVPSRLRAISLILETLCNAQVLSSVIQGITVDVVHLASIALHEIHNFSMKVNCAFGRRMDGVERLFGFAPQSVPAKMSESLKDVSINGCASAIGKGDGVTFVAGHPQTSHLSSLGLVPQAPDAPKCISFAEDFGFFEIA